MKIRITAATLFLSLCSSWSMLGSFALRSKEDRLEDDDLLRFHMMIKEEEETDRNVVSLRDLIKVGKDKNPRAREESVPVERIMKTIIDATKPQSDRDLQVACDSELAVLQNCYASDFNCDPSCIVAVEDQLFRDNNGTVSCDQYNAVICPSFATCGCETCELDFSDYYNCESTNLCTVNCGSTPSPTPAPTAQQICPEELDRVVACVQNMDTCVTCITDAFDSINENSDNICAAIVTGICPAIKTDCDCGECRELWQEFYSCAFIEICPALDCNLDPTESTPSPANSPHSPTTPEPQNPSSPSETEPPTGISPRGTDTQSSEEGGGISIAIIVGAIGGIVVVVGIIVGAVLYSRRNRSNINPQKPVVNNPVDTSHDKTENNAPSTPGRLSEYGASPGSPASSLTFSYSQNTGTTPNANNPDQGFIPSPKYGEPNYEEKNYHPQGVLDNPHTYYQPSASHGNEYQQQHRPSQQYPPQQKDIRSIYSAHSSSTSSHTTPSRQSYQGQQQQQHSLPPPPTPGYMPTNKDQCRTVLRGEEEGIFVEATPVMMVESTPVMTTDVHSVTSNAVNSSSDGSKSRRPALDP